MTELSPEVEREIDAEAEALQGGWMTPRQRENLVQALRAQRRAGQTDRDGEVAIICAEAEDNKLQWQAAEKSLQSERERAGALAAQVEELQKELGKQVEEVVQETEKV